MSESVRVNRENKRIKRAQECLREHGSLLLDGEFVRPASRDAVRAVETGLLRAWPFALPT